MAIFLYLVEKKTLIDNHLTCVRTNYSQIAEINLEPFYRTERKRNCTTEELIHQSAKILFCFFLLYLTIRNLWPKPVHSPLMMDKWENDHMHVSLSFSNVFARNRNAWLSYWTAWRCNIIWNRVYKMKTRRDFEWPSDIDVWLHSNTFITLNMNRQRSGRNKETFLEILFGQKFAKKRSKSKKPPKKKLRAFDTHTQAGKQQQANQTAYAFGDI